MADHQHSTSIATAMTLPRSGLTLQIAQTPDGRMIIFGGLGRTGRIGR